MFAVCCQNYIKIFDSKIEATEWFELAGSACSHEHRLVLLNGTRWEDS